MRLRDRDFLRPPQRGGGRYLDIYPPGVYYCFMRQASRTINARIHKLSGQLQAIEEMVNTKRSCTDVLNQISAIRAGLEQLAGILFEREIRKNIINQNNFNKLQKLINQYNRTI